MQTTSLLYNVLSFSNMRRFQIGREGVVKALRPGLSTVVVHSPVAKQSSMVTVEVKEASALSFTLPIFASLPGPSSRANQGAERTNPPISLVVGGTISLPFLYFDSLGRPFHVGCITLPGGCHLTS